MVFCAAFVGVAYPLVLVFHVLGIESAFRSFAADAFYYLAIADHSRGAAFYTFDGRYPTNGFHPLWAYLLTAIFRFLPQSQELQVLLVYTFGGAFTATGAAILALCFLHLSRSPALSLVAAVPGFHYVLLSTIDPHYAATWSFANGMESPLSILLFGAFAHRLVVANDLGRGSLRGVVTLSALASALVLARLDDVFLLPPLIVCIAVTAPTRRLLATRTLAAAAVPFAVLGAYLLYNQSYAGTMFPVSGTAKLSAAAWQGNLTAFLDAFAPLLDRNAAWGGATWRVLNMVLPAVVAATWLAAVVIRRDARFLPRYRELPSGGAQVVIILSGYVLLKAGYNFLNVGLWNQGHWYYPLSIITANLLLLLAIAGPRRGVAAEPAPRDVPDAGAHSVVGARPPRVTGSMLAAAGAVALLAALAVLAGTSDSPAYLGRYSGRRLAIAMLALALAASLLLFASEGMRDAASRLIARHRVSRGEGVATAAAAAYVLLLANAFANLKLGDPRGAEFHRFWAQRHEIATVLKQAGFDAPIVECDDGIVSYALPFSTMSGFALALDREAFEASRRLALLDVAYDRGARLIGSVWYVRDWPDAASAGEDALRELVRDLCWGQRVERWKFRVVRQSRDPAFPYVFIAFEPR